MVKIVFELKTKLKFRFNVFVVFSQLFNSDQCYTGKRNPIQTKNYSIIYECVCMVYVRV